MYCQSNFEKHEPVVEQLGSYDPLPNEHNEKLVALNYERLRYWIGMGAVTSKPVEQLLGIKNFVMNYVSFVMIIIGIAGFYPIHPTSYMTAWRNRKALAKQEQDELEAKTKEEEKAKESISTEEKTE